MNVIVSMLRGVNVGGHNKIKMADLKKVYEALGFERVQTYIQSGNVVFATKERGDEKLARKIGAAIEKKFGFCPEVIVRTAEEMRSIVKRNPFAKRGDVEPGKLLVVFLASDPGKAARDVVAEIEAKEELRPLGSEIYIYFPDGQGKSKLKFGLVEKATNKVAWTGRNWNTVLKLVELCEQSL